MYEANERKITLKILVRTLSVRPFRTGEKHPSAARAVRQQFTQIPSRILCRLFRCLHIRSRTQIPSYILNRMELRNHTQKILHLLHALHALHAFPEKAFTQFFSTSKSNTFVSTAILPF